MEEEEEEEEEEHSVEGTREEGGGGGGGEGVGERGGAEPSRRGRWGRMRRTKTQTSSRRNSSDVNLTRITSDEAKKKAEP